MSGNFSNAEDYYSSIGVEETAIGVAVSVLFFVCAASCAIRRIGLFDDQDLGNARRDSDLGELPMHQLQNPLDPAHFYPVDRLQGSAGDPFVPQGDINMESPPDYYQSPQGQRMIPDIPPAYEDDRSMAASVGSNSSRRSSINYDDFNAISSDEEVSPGPVSAPFQPHIDRFEGRSL